jgi:cell division protein FtsL
MAISLNSPSVGLIALAVGTFLLGSQLGGEMARRREIKEEIRDIQRQHKETLARMDSVYKSALQRDAQALEQVNALYTLLNDLQIKEVQVRGNIAVVKKKIDENKQATQQLQNEVKKASENSSFTFYDNE